MTFYGSAVDLDDRRGLGGRRSAGRAPLAASARSTAFGDDAKPGMVIDPGHDLGLGAIGKKAGGGHVQLP
jgi:hypothetical protein